MKTLALFDNSHNPLPSPGRIIDCAWTVAFNPKLVLSKGFTGHSLPQHAHAHTRLTDGTYDPQMPSHTFRYDQLLKAVKESTNVGIRAAGSDCALH